MPIGPNGEKRPVSTVQSAHRIVQIATGQAEEEYVDDEGVIRVEKRKRQTFDADDLDSVEAFAAGEE